MLQQFRVQLSLMLKSVGMRSERKMNGNERNVRAKDTDIAEYQFQDILCTCCNVDSQLQCVSGKMMMKSIFNFWIKIEEGRKVVRVEGKG